MKKILLAIFILSGVFTKSQTLTQTANEPKVGDVDIEYLMDTTAFTSGLPISVTGSNCVWDFSGLSSYTVLTNNYLSPTAVPSASAYAGCSLVQESGLSYTFLKSVATPSAQTELIGLTLPLGSVNFTNTAIAARYPISYSYSLTDNVSGSFSSTITNGSCSGNITTKADGLGTLNLPQGQNYTNVLRVKTFLSLSLVAGFIPIATVKQTIYSYYHISNKFPVLNINYTAMQITGSSSPTISASVQGNSAMLLALQKLNQVNENAVSIYPNPAKSTLVIANNSMLKIDKIKVFNMLNQLVLESPQVESLNVSALCSGNYFMLIETEKGSVYKRFIKE